MNTSAHWYKSYLCIYQFMLCCWVRSLPSWKWCGSCNRIFDWAPLFILDVPCILSYGTVSKVELSSFKQILCHYFTWMVKDSLWSSSDPKVLPSAPVCFIYQVLSSSISQDLPGHNFADKQNFPRFEPIVRCVSLSHTLISKGTHPIMFLVHQKFHGVKQEYELSIS